MFVRLLIPLMMGIYCFYNCENSLYLTVNVIISTILFITLLGINLFYKTFAAYRFKYLNDFLLKLLFFFFGGCLCLLNKETLRATYFGNHPNSQLKVLINSEPQQGQGTIKFTANVITGYRNHKIARVCGKLLIIVKTDLLRPSTYTYGDELIIHSNFSTIQPPFNPGEFDFKAWLAVKNVYQQTFLTQNNVVKTGANKGNPLFKFAINLRQKQIEIYKNTIRDKEAFAVASTLILGYRADLSSETLASYSKTGTIHALSVSGMHVGIIYIVLNWMLSFMNTNAKWKIVKVISICSFIWFYALLTGFSPSVLRSVIMLTVYILAKSFNKHTNGYNIVAFTAFCMLIYDPFLIWDVGFQLSFIAVLGLIYLHPKIYKWYYFKPRWADWLWSSVALSLAAQIATFPLSVYYFHQFPLYFIFSNLFILMPIILLMYLGISILLFRVYLLAPVFEWLIIFMNDGLKWIANLPFSGIEQIWIDKIQLLTLGVSLIIGLIAFATYKKYHFLIALAILFMFQASLTLKHIRSTKQKKIIFFILQRGYAAAFINANNAILLSNLDKREKNFQFYIQPGLDQLGIKNVQFLKWEIDTSLSSFTKRNHQIDFHGYRILLLDTSFSHKTINQTLFFNGVWMHQNPKITINNLRRWAIFESLIIDATNYNNTLEKYTIEANKFQIQSHILKKNKAYLIDLTKLTK